MVNRCEICGKKMHWWQDLVIAFDKIGDSFPIMHNKCSDKQGSKPYYAKRGNHDDN